MNALVQDLLPPSLHDLVEVIGLRAALALVERWGGTRVYIPEHAPGSDHPLAQQIGQEATRKLCRAYAGETMSVPRAYRALRAALYRQIRHDYHQRGRSAAELAREHGMTERWVYAIVSSAEGDRLSPQLGLL
ncbi:MAG TPA: Mor transcription activator family protein [Nevskiales bacterium]|nr:Mor transcription activator family protein [Nevskiales bacterium]